MKKILIAAFAFLYLTKFSNAQPVMIGEYTEVTLNALQQNQQKNFRATTERSDTIDLLHFNIHLTVGNGSNQTIGGYSIIDFKARMNNVNQIYLDLMKMNVDSVVQNNQLLSFTYADSVIMKINLLSTMMLNDSDSIIVYYHGHPYNDGTFGGVYFNGDFAYNVGMSLYEIPHNVGRTWHPCYDNFVERASYEFYITCDSLRMALCNGALIDSSQNGNGTVTWHWKQNETVPTFITGFAVSKFAPVHWNFAGLNGNVPVMLGAIAADTTAMKNSFIHLHDCFDIFEQHYGPYVWNKVGFNKLPFDAGAMEHAGSIVYPSFACGGNTVYEDLMAHELAHHWFGNEATPFDASEIWLKEGWAVFSEFLFFEGEYGSTIYKSKVAENHEIALHYDQVFDNGYQPLSPMPLYTTFGRTTYTKSADIVHTLRTYMGDSLFFGCLKSFVAAHSFLNYTSADLRDYLSSCSGINLSDFFNDWVFAPGFPHFSIDSFNVSANGNGWYHVAVTIRQKLNNAPHFYNHVPLEITFRNSNMESTTEQLEVGGPCTVYETDLPFIPSFVCSDLSDKISDAITDEYQTISNAGYHNFVSGKMNLNITSITDSAFIRIEHNFVCPDPLKNPIANLHLSQERYWRVDGIFPSGFDSKATILYNATNPPPTSYNGAYLDRKLITNSEDSLRLMYRSAVANDWQIESDISMNYSGSHTDGKGIITINHLKKGEYTLAIYQENKVDSVITPVTQICQSIINDVTTSVVKNELVVYPNPAQTDFILEGSISTDCTIEIFNLLGENIYKEKLAKGFINKSIDTNNFADGILIIKISDGAHQILLHKEVVIR